MTLADLSTLVAHYGYDVVFAALLLASAGVPAPAGELLVAASIYAAKTGRLSLAVLTLGGIAMAILGGVAGYGIGHTLGAVGLRRYGGRLGLGPARQRLGRYLFLKHGGKIVFFIRFIALLGPFGGLLAGVNRMPWARFLAFNALGAAAWVSVMAVGGYLFGAFFASVGRPIGFAALAGAIAVAIAAALYVHRQGATLQAKADALLGCDDG
ncbi:MAG: DedA family protein [Pseudomonadota bacterium]|nr:DedA family protein [Pseudomonadota bacterium]